MIIEKPNTNEYFINIDRPNCDVYVKNVNDILNTHFHLDKKEEKEEKKVEEEQNMKYAIDIQRVQVFNNCCVKVEFSDGTVTKAVCSKNDHFDVDTGITICIVKKLLGKDGTRLYNNAIRKAHIMMEAEEECKRIEAEAIKQAKEREEKLKRRLQAEREKAERKYVELHAAAYLQALKAVKEQEQNEET